MSERIGGRCLELVTGTLDPEYLMQQITVTAIWLRAIGIDQVFVEYGWGCNLDAGSLWQKQEVSLENLGQFATQAAAAGVFRPGGADLIVSEMSGSFQIIFCHESDIHIKTESLALLDTARTEWARQGISSKRKTEDGSWVAA